MRPMIGGRARRNRSAIVIGAHAVVFDRDGLRRNLLSGQRAASDLRRGVLAATGGTPVPAPRRAPESTCLPIVSDFGERTRERRNVGMSSASAADSRYSRSVASSAAIVSLPQRNARCSGFLLDLIHARRRADDQTGLRPAQHLVAAERHDVGAERDPLGHHRLLRQAVLAQVDERAAAEIFHHRDARASFRSRRARPGRPRRQSRRRGSCWCAPSAAARCSPVIARS